MKPLAFISHSENGGASTSERLMYRLDHSDLCLQGFYSKHDLYAGDDIHEEIIRNIVNTDILIGIIEPDAISSSWVKWEHDFCRERNLDIILIILPSVWDDYEHDRIPFLNSGILAIPYNLGSDMMLDNFYIAIKKNKAKLMTRAKEKEKITISVDPINSSYQNSDTVIISGKVESVGLKSMDSNFLNIYVHKRNFDSANEPITTKILKDSITLDPKNEFSFDFKISDITQIEKSQKLFLEIRFENKSEIVTISICPPDTSINGTASSKTPSSGTISKASTARNLYSYYVK